jgi:hypothetical protein
MSLRNRMFLAIGYLYRAMYRLPRAGDRMVRGTGRFIASGYRRSPYAIGTCGSVAEFRQGFERLLKLADLPAEVTGHDDEKLELVVKRCPYGFSGPKHRDVCDAAMDMDRIMYRYSDMELVIDECIPDGATDCRISIHRIKPDG